MHVDLGAMLAASCAGADKQISVASRFLASMPNLADPEDSSQLWQPADSSQQSAAEVSTVQLPSYLQGKPTLPAGSERPPTPAVNSMPMDDSSPLRVSPSCLQSTALLDVRSTAAEDDSWLHMPSDDEEAAPAAPPPEQPVEGGDGGEDIVEEEVEEAVSCGPAGLEQTAQNSKPRVPTLQKRRRAFVLPDDDEAPSDALNVRAATHGDASGDLAQCS